MNPYPQYSPHQFRPDSCYLAPDPVPGESPYGKKGPFSRDKLAAWYKASRPPFYIATVIPLLLGFVLAGRDTGNWYWGRFLLVNLGAFMVHLATNLADDLFDHILGADAGESIGGSRMLQRGKITLSQLAWALVILYSAAFFVAALVIFRTGLHQLWIVVFIAWFSSFFYVAPPVKYGYRGLGELFVFINMGFIMVGGSYLIQAGSWRWDLVLYSLPVGLMVANILYFQSLPDMKTDKAVGKYTLAVKLGKKTAIQVFRLWWAATYVCMLILYLTGKSGWPVLGFILTLPLFFKADRIIGSTENWVELDQHGHLVRKLYFINGVLLVVSAGAFL